MAKKLYEEASISDIADAIRAKGGSGTYTVGDMAQAIEDLPSGGGITADGIALRTEPAGAVVLTCTQTRENAFSENTGMTSLVADSLTVLRGYSFRLCTSLQSVSMAALQTVAGVQAFLSCSALRTVNFPNLQTANNNFLQGCTSLEFIDFPKLTQLNRVRTLYGCTSLKTLILRHTSVVPLSNDCFTNTPFDGYGGLTGTVYVPSSLISSYQTATNWSTLYNNGTCRFVAIEGSPYE